MIKYFFPVLIFITTLVSGQELQIEVNLPTAANKKINLAYHYIENIFIRDTLHLDENGAGTFTSDTLAPQGLYKIYLDEKNHFDFLIGADQTFSIESSSFSVDDIKINGSTETKEFIAYVVFLKNLQTRSAEIRNELKTATDDRKKELQEEMKTLTPSLHNYWNDINEKYPDTFVAKFLMSNLVPALDISTLPEEIQNNDSLLLIARFEYQQDHFWENFDYTDERFLFTPLYKPKLETWFNKVLYQNYDSVKPYVFDFIENTRPSKRIFKFVASWFLNTTVNSKVMGMDALFVDIAKTYYLSGEAFWTDEKTIDNIEENVLFAENNLIGMTAPNLNVESVDGEYFELHQVESKYTVVLIYEPDCSHCKVFVPEFHEQIYKKYRDKGLEVFAIYSMDDKEIWTEFLTKHDLYDWINVWDEHHVTRFKILYDARNTPGVYVLDENKKIVSKKMTVKQLDRFFESVL